jgi:hypothetical protein
MYTREQIKSVAGHWWLTAIIPATQETEIRRLAVQNQARQNSSVRPCLKKSLHKNRAGGVAQGEGLEFKP